MAKDYIQINKEVYDALATEYSFRRDNIGPYSESTEFLGNALLKYAPRKSPLQVLEIGPGAGQILRFFEDNNCRTIGVELSAEMSKICRIQSPDSVVLTGNILDINFSNEQFDLIYIGAVIHLFPLQHARALLKNIWKWTKTGGHIFINTTCHEQSSEGYSEKKDYSSGIRFRRYWKEADFQKEVVQSGFSIVEKLYTDEKDREKLWVAIIGKKE